MGLSTYHGDQFFSIAVAWRKSENDEPTTLFVDFPVDPKTRKVDYSKPSSDLEWKHILSMLTDSSIIKAFHNAKYDVKMIRAAGFKINGPIVCTLLAAKCSYTQETAYGAKPLAKKYFSMEDEDESDLKSSVVKARNLARRKHPEIKLGEKPEQDYWLPKYFDPESKLNEIYNVKDAVRALLLWEFYEQALTEMNCWEAYNLEMELMEILIEMEDRGIRFDYNACLETIGRNWKDIAEVKKAFHECIPVQHRPKEPVNLSSPKQLIDLFQKLELPLYNPEGKFTTNGDDIEKLVGPHAKEGGPLATDYPILYWLLMYRGYIKGEGNLKSYIEFAVDDHIKSVSDMPNWRNCKAIHANVNQSNTTTFRLSYNDPNLQQCANPKTSDGFNVIPVRHLFGPREGYVWYCVDFKQLELRIFASRANEPKLIEVFNAGGDPHDKTRTSVPYLASKDKGVGRKLAKNTNFSIVNRGGKKVLYQKYGIPEDEGAIIIRQLYEEFPDMELRQKFLYEFAKDNGYIYNAYGRKLDIIPEFAYTCGPAYDIQGSAADFIKRSIVRARKILRRNSHLDAHIVLQIHDEVIFEIRKDHCFKWLLIELKDALEDHDGAFRILMQSEWAKTTTSWADKSDKGMEWLNSRPPFVREYDEMRGLICS